MSMLVLCANARRKRSSPFGTYSLALALLQDFFDELFDRVHVHPIGAIDKGKAVFIAFRSAVAARHFILGNIDPQRVRALFTGGKDSLVGDLALARQQPVKRHFGRVWV